MRTSLLYVTFFLSAILVDRTHAFNHLRGSCFESWHIDSESVTKDLSEYAGCKIKITTSENEILAFRFVEGDISHLGDSIKIYDGHDSQAPLVLLDDRKLSAEFKKVNVNYNKTVYTTGTSATLDISEGVEPGHHLKIQRAVECPSDLGSDSACGRLFDDVSCYCITFSWRTWYEQIDYCSNYGMELISLETAEEEKAVYAVWGAGRLWTSGTDAEIEGQWVWQSTGKNLYPGYADWDVGEPNGEMKCYSPAGSEDCLLLNFNYASGWYDAGCDTMSPAVCEKNP